jgi:hypothetical protein
MVFILYGIKYWLAELAYRPLGITGRFLPSTPNNVLEQLLNFCQKSESAAPLIRWKPLLSGHRRILQT